ncbi:MAG: glycosyltransferase family 2 protein [Clostridia bacterium]|nr:glycosyltransferase family 2 protein [Clostridia bacterium]
MYYQYDNRSGVSDMKYKISIIIAVYNSLRYIKDALESLEKQTIGIENLQIIAVDDCSDDGSYEYLLLYAEKNNNVKVLQTTQNSGGASLPRNIALENVSAPYIMFLDSDDYYEPDACMLLYDEAQASNAELVTGYYRDVACDKAIINDKNGCFALANRKEYNLPDDMLCAMEVNGIFWCKIYRADIISANNIRFKQDIKIAEDTLFLLEYMLCIRKLVYIDVLVNNYRAGDTVSRTIDEKALETISKSYLYIKDLLVGANQNACFNREAYTIAANFIPQIFSSDKIDPSQQREILQKWHWLVSYTLENDLAIYTGLQRAMFVLIADKHFDDAVELGRAIEAKDAALLESEKAVKAKDAAIHKHQQAMCNKDTAMQAQQVSMAEKDEAMKMQQQDIANKNNYIVSLERNSENLSEELDSCKKVIENYEKSETLLNSKCEYYKSQLDELKANKLVSFAVKVSGVK